MYNVHNCDCPEERECQIAFFKIHIFNIFFFIFRLWLAGSFIGLEQTGTRKSSSTNSTSSKDQKSKTSIVPKNSSSRSTTSDYR